MNLTSEQQFDWKRFLHDSVSGNSGYGLLLRRYIRLGQAMNAPRTKPLGMMRRWALKLARRRLKIRMHQISSQRSRAKQTIRTLRRAELA